MITCKIFLLALLIVHYSLYYWHIFQLHQLEFPHLGNHIDTDGIPMPSTYVYTHRIANENNASSHASKLTVACEAFQ